MTVDTKKLRDGLREQWIGHGVQVPGVLDALDELDALRAENATLRDKLADAVRNLEPWKKLATDHATDKHDAVKARDEVLETNRKLVEENDALTMRVAELEEETAEVMVVTRGSRVLGVFVRGEEYDQFRRSEAEDAAGTSEPMITGTAFPLRGRGKS